MAKYIVAILNEEGSDLADVISLTGTVNGVPTSAKVRISSTKKMSVKAKKSAKLTALAQAFQEKSESVSANSQGEEITL